MIGRSVGPYRILERLGSGGMGDVYLAEDPRLDRKVALKRPSDTWLAAPDARQRLLREARAAARLSHPHIAAVHDVLDVDGRPYIVMEYVAGESLAACLRRGRLPIERAVEIGVEIAEAVAEAHAHGVLHRDLKPGNIALTPDGRVKVLDFGLARVGPASPDVAARPSNASLATPGAFLGTPGYAAPEQLAGGAVDERADVFAIGAILFEAIAGRPAFPGRDSMALAMATVSATVPRVGSLNPAAPLELDAIVARALHKAPDGRYPSAREVAAALKRVHETLADRPTGALDALPAPEAPRPAGRHAPWRGALAIAGSAAALAAIVWGAMRLGGRDTPLSAATPVVAVLPFEVTGDDPQTAALAAGLADTLTLDLSALRSMVVVPRKETLALGGADGPARAAREQGATYVVRGALSQAGTALQLNVSLVSPADGRAVWRQSYHGPAASAIVLEQRARQDLAFALRGSLSSETFAQIGTIDAQAFAYYSQGRSFLDRWDVPGNLDHAIELLRAAIARDHAYAVAHASLGEAYWTKYTQTKDAAWTQQARDATLDALALNPNLPQVRYTLAVIYRGSGRTDEAIEQLRLALAEWPTAAAHRLLGETLAGRGDIDGAVHEFELALAIGPGYWQTYAAFGAAALRAGRYDQARAVLERLVELQPDNAVGFRLLGALYQTLGDNAQATEAYEKAIALAPNAAGSAYSNLGLLQYTAGRFEEAAHAFEAAVRFSPTDAVLRRNLGDAYRRIGRTKDARAAYAEAARLAEAELGVNGRDLAMVSLLAVCEAKLGHAAAARQHVASAVGLAPSTSEVWYRLAVASALVGDTTPALAYLERALAAGYSARLVASDDDLSSLRHQPRFRQLVSTGS